MPEKNIKKAVLIPCYNEEATVEKVIADFRANLPEADIYVYDNNSTDRTSEIVSEYINNNFNGGGGGLFLRKEFRQGKGNVVQSMFAEIDADVYIMVDGDDTYPAEQVRELIAPVLNEKCDMCVGDRLTNGTYAKENKRWAHNFGNNLVRSLINFFFKSKLHDIMSGYRAFSKRFVKNYPILSKGFEIETEMTLHALDRGFNVKEVPIEYRDRPEGSESKLNTITDGFLVLFTIGAICKDYHPLKFFGIIGSLLTLIGLIAGWPVIFEFIRTSYITHVPLAVLSAAIMIIALLTFSCGIILNSVAKNDKKSYALRMLDYDNAERERGI